MFCQYQYYRRWTEKLQTAVDHSDGKYQCKDMWRCSYTGTTVMEKIPWAGEAGDKKEEDQAEEDQAEEDQAEEDQAEEDQAEESGTNREEDREEEIIIEEPAAASVQERILSFEKMFSK